MKVTIKIDDEDDEIDATFSNDELSNYNFVDVSIGNRYYTFLVEDLYRVAKIFNEIRLDNKE